MKYLIKIFRLWPEIFGLPVVLVVLIGFPVILEYSGLLYLYSVNHPDPAEQTAILRKLEFIPAAFSILLFCNAAALSAIKFNRPDLWFIYRQIILNRSATWEFPAEAKDSFRAWFWRYFFAALIASVASLWLIV